MNSNSLVQALKGKQVKEGTYTFLHQFMDELLNKGCSTTIFNAEGEGVLTSPVEDWFFLEQGVGIIITQNSAYHVMFK